MAQQLFIVFHEGGRWSDETFSYPVKAWSTRDAAEKHVEELTEKLEHKRRIAEGMREVRNAMIKANPAPNMPKGSLPKPKWPAGLGAHQITQEMRDERARVDAHNDKIQAEYSAAYQEWSEHVIGKAKREYLRSQGIPDSTPSVVYDSVPDENQRYVIHDEITLD